MTCFRSGHMSAVCGVLGHLAGLVTVISMVFILATGVMAQGWYGTSRSPQPRQAATSSSRPTSFRAPGTIVRMRNQMQYTFDRFLKDPQHFAATVERQCNGFPSGRMLAYVFPTMAYTNLAASRPEYRTEAAERIAVLCQLALNEAAPLIGSATPLKISQTGFPPYSSDLGFLAVALGCYRLVGGDNRFVHKEKALVDSIAAALQQSGYRPLPSSPQRYRNIDTIPCLLALSVADRNSATATYQPIIDKHLTWIAEEGTDRRSGLPNSSYDPATGAGTGAPRGSDIGLRVCLLGQIDPELSKQLYRRMVATFWDQGFLASGFREWPHGVGRGQDRDSGPFLFGLGVYASGYGLGAMMVNRDYSRLNIFAGLLDKVPTLKRWTMGTGSGQQYIGDMIPYYSQYFTGFLYGEAAFFYVSSWTEWNFDN